MIDKDKRHLCFNSTQNTFGVLCPAPHETKWKRRNWKENIFLLPFPSTAIVNLSGMGRISEGKGDSLWKVKL